MKTMLGLVFGAEDKPSTIFDELRSEFRELAPESIPPIESPAAPTVNFLTKSLLELSIRKVVEEE
jgi:hypothetical protein